MMRRMVLLIAMTISLSLPCAAWAAKGSDKAAIDKLLDAIARVESNHDSRAVGDSGRALGAYQIHRSYWKDGTRILGVDWSYELARDPSKARQVVRAYLLHYGKGRTLLEKARIHNGGPRGYRKKATLKYARKIARILQRTKGKSTL